MPINGPESLRGEKQASCDPFDFDQEKTQRAIHQSVTEKDIALQNGFQ